MLDSLIELLENAVQKLKLPERQSDVNAKGGTLRSLHLLQSPDANVKLKALRLLELLLANGNTAVQDVVLKHVGASTALSSGPRLLGSGDGAGDGYTFLHELDSILQTATEDERQPRNSTAMDMPGRGDIVSLTLRVLRYLCVGNPVAQSMVRGEGGGPNFVTRLFGLIEALGPVSAIDWTTAADDPRLERLLLCLEAVAAMAQGPCIINQELIIQRGFNVLMDLLGLQYPWELSKHDESMARVGRHLLRTTTVVFLALLEGERHDAHAALFRRNKTLVQRIEERVKYLAMMPPRPRRGVRAARVQARAGRLYAHLHSAAVPAGDRPALGTARCCQEQLPAWCSADRCARIEITRETAWRWCSSASRR